MIAHHALAESLHFSARGVLLRDLAKLHFGQSIFRCLRDELAIVTRKLLRVGLLVRAECAAGKGKRKNADERACQPMCHGDLLDKPCSRTAARCTSEDCNRYARSRVRVSRPRLASPATRRRSCRCLARRL